MTADLSRFKVVYGDKVLNAVSLLFVDMGKYEEIANKTRFKPTFIEVIVINEDGNLEIIRDETWRFQFLPIVSKGGTE